MGLDILSESSLPVLFGDGTKASNSTAHRMSRELATTESHRVLS